MELNNVLEVHEKAGVELAVISNPVHYVRGKPDPEVFDHVACAVGRSPERLLFLDDNTLNVEAARAVGLIGLQVRRVEEAQRVLVEKRDLSAVMPLRKMAISGPNPSARVHARNERDHDQGVETP